MSSAVAGSNRCTSTTLAPTCSVMPSTTFSPKMWNIGKHAEHHVIGALAGAAGQGLLDVGEEVAVAEHRGLRVPGGAAREHEHGEVVGLHVQHRHRRLAGQLLPCEGPVDRIDRHDGGQLGHLGPVDAGPMRGRAPADEDRLGADVGQLALERGGRALRVERHGHGAQAEHRQVALHEVGAVGAEQGDPVAVTDAETGERGRASSRRRGEARRR